MKLYGDDIVVVCDQTAGLFHGNGYGIGKKYIFIGRFVKGSLWGDVILFDKTTGDKLFKIEMEESAAHGRYEFYESGTLVEKGMYEHGNKYFHTKFQNNEVYEYGWSKNDKLNGFGATTDKDGFVYTSPHWVHGVINGLGCIQDKNKDIVFYGTFKQNIPLVESNEKHPTLTDKWERAENDKYMVLPVECVEKILKS